MPNRPSARVAIACQGGGSHTAFTAGVLKALLRGIPGAKGNSAGEVEVVALSGTSGGAICALLAWDGLLHGEPERGVGKLECFWADNAASDPWSALLNQWLQCVLRMGTFMALPTVSPYAVPPWGPRQIRAMLERRVDFTALREAARRPGAPGLLIGAVEVRSGKFEVFRGPELCVEAVLASIAVPRLFPAVAVPGRGEYWDGLLSQNPPVRDLADYEPDELWVVQVNPPTRKDVPTTADAITDRQNELACNLSLEQELWFIEKVNGFLRDEGLAGERYRPTRVHRIIMQRDLDYVSKLDRSPRFLSDLMAYGEEAGDRFLRERQRNAGPFCDPRKAPVPRRQPVGSRGGDGRSSSPPAPSTSGPEDLAIA